MIRLFSGRTADDVWLKVSAALLERDALPKQGSRAGLTQELLHVALSIRYPAERWVVSRQRPINPAFALAEVVWILTGRNDSAFLNYFNSQYPRFAGHGETYHGAYGFRLRKNLGIDQLERAYLALRSRPDSRQVVLQIWDGKVDFPDDNGNPVSEDIPCNVVSLLKVRNGALEWFQIMRSNDLYFGLPYNFVQFTVLQEVMAGWLGLKVHSYNHISDSLHLYERDRMNVVASKPISSEPNTDLLALGKKESDRCFGELGAAADRIIDKTSLPQELALLVARSQLPPAYLNILRVLVAEGLRKRRRTALSKSIMADCTNPAFRQIYTRWVERVEGNNPNQ